MTERAAFGEELQRTRERRGLSLDDMAARTKISGSLFAGLERGDLSRWPSGIFRRAFVRAYAQAVGLDPEETVARFRRVYPDLDGVVPQLAPGDADPEAESDSPGPRLVLDESQIDDSSAGAWRSLRRVGAPLVDLLLAGIPALVAGSLFGWQWFWVVAAGVGLVGHTLMLSFAGATPGAWLLFPRPPVRPRVLDEAPARRRAEPEAVASMPAARRRQPRHASSARAGGTARSRHVQH